MRSIAAFALVGLVALAGGCGVVDGESTDDQNDCLVAYLTPAIRIYGVDGKSICDTTVVVSEVAYELTLARSGGCGPYKMPDRRGLYKVTVTAPGYRSVVRDGVRVGDEPAGNYGCSGPDNTVDDIEVTLERE